MLNIYLAQLEKWRTVAKSAAYRSGEQGLGTVLHEVATRLEDSGSAQAAELVRTAADHVIPEQGALSWLADDDLDRTAQRIHADLS
ncbi:MULTISPECIES: hypothetical protein [Paraburkholderia]|uniref:hypothetical protein n=1 Tax=Paraburkholderia TaxID=1822464 RepID=UPI0003670620|nr:MULTISPECIES: hypothetical protein [Paraburkholderia]